MHWNILWRVDSDPDLVDIDGQYNYLDFITEANGRSCSKPVIRGSSITLQFTGDKPRAKQWVCRPSEFGRYLALVMRSKFRTLWRHF